MIQTVDTDEHRYAQIINIVVLREKIEVTGLAIISVSKGDRGIVKIWGQRKDRNREENKKTALLTFEWVNSIMCKNPLNFKRSEYDNKGSVGTGFKHSRTLKFSLRFAQELDYTN